MCSKALIHSLMSSKKSHHRLRFNHQNQFIPIILSIEVYNNNNLRRTTDITVQNFKQMNKVKPKEFWVQASQAVLCQIIRTHQKQRRWHYGVSLAADNPNSLASLLQLTQSEADILLTSIKKIWNFIIIHEWTPANNGRLCLIIICNFLT